MKSILQPIKPQYCGLIASGRKTIEVRKTRPKLQTPFKVYIYMTTEKRLLIFIKKGDYCGIDPDGEPAYADRNEPVRRYNPLERKVIGEYVCDEIEKITADNLIALYFNNPSNETCLTDLEMRKYANGKPLYLWHISALKIYDKPKELSEFYKSCGTQNCRACQFWFNNGEYAACETRPMRQLKCPPQSWCYVEEV